MTATHQPPPNPLAMLDLERGILARPLGSGAEASQRHEACAGTLHVTWARHADEVAAAQRLRYQVFGVEMGANLDAGKGALDGLDVDRFDAHCEHLIVSRPATDEHAAQVVGTYRVLTPAAARRAGGLYSDTEFDLSALDGLRSQLAELGRSCVHPGHRNGTVIMALWSALARFMHANRLSSMIGCASMGMQDGGHTAASVWRQLSEHHLSPVPVRAHPRLPLPVEQLNSHLPVTPPPLIGGYLRCGAKLLGAPAWDPDFNTADLPMLLHFADIPARYRRHFLGE